MLRELLIIFRASDPVDRISQDFTHMLELASDMIRTAGRVFFAELNSEDEVRAELFERDRRVNALERDIRRQVFTHLTVRGAKADIPFSLMLMSLVKDVERLGDYAKNLSQVRLIDADPLPENELTGRLRQIRREVEQAAAVLAGVFRDSRKDEAVALIEKGREVARLCDALVMDVGRSDCDSGSTTVLVLGARYYKRLGGHIQNILSSVVMPLDQIDYYKVPDSHSV